MMKAMEMEMQTIQDVDTITYAAFSFDTIVHFFRCKNIENVRKYVNIILQQKFSTTTHQR